MDGASRNLREHLRDPGRIVVYDLEWTSWKGFLESGWDQPGRHREVIQIGAVLIDCRDDFAEQGKLNVLVRPKLNPQLSTYVQDLTGIRQDQVDADGIAFADALALFAAFCDGAERACANGADGTVIAENCSLHDTPCPPVLANTVNLRPLFTHILNAADGPVDSGDLTGHLGLPSVGANHDALADARGVAAALRHLFDRPLEV